MHICAPTVTCTMHLIGTGCYRLSSSSPSAHVRVLGQVMSLSSEVPRAPSSQPRSGSAAKAKDSSGRAVEPPLEVMPITFWRPPA